jgi:hypothetical protein
VYNISHTSSQRVTDYNLGSRTRLQLVCELFLLRELAAGCPLLEFHAFRRHRLFVLGNQACDSRNVALGETFQSLNFGDKMRTILFRLSTHGCQYLVA